MIAAFFAAFLMSFVGSMLPAGPIAMIVLDRGMRGSSRSALFLASGGAVAEAGWAALAYLGMTFVLSRYPVQASVMRISAGILLLVFAVVLIARHRACRPPAKIPEYGGANFLLGLTIAGLNPTFLVTWSGIVAVARGAGLDLEVQGAAGFALGVAAGPVLWFSIVLKLLARHRHRFRPALLEKTKVVLPIILLTAAGIILAQGLIELLHRG